MNLNLENLFKNTKNKQTFEAGTVIFAEGNRADSMYVVLDGEVDV
jgi:CRP-like cAMP-binding protein